MDTNVKMPEKIIKKYGDYVDLFEHGTEKEIELVNIIWEKQFMKCRNRGSVIKNGNA